MSAKIMFKVGDRVVYPSHGVGEIVAEEVQVVGGNQFNVFVILFMKEKMMLRIPINRAVNVGLRPLSDSGEVSKMFSILRGKTKLKKAGMWSRRAQEYELKINSGQLSSIAEVVRDLYRSVDSERSYSERMIYESALNRLANEFAAVEEIDPKLAMEKLMDALQEKEAA